MKTDPASPDYTPYITMMAPLLIIGTLPIAAVLLVATVEKILFEKEMPPSWNRKKSHNRWVCHLQEAFFCQTAEKRTRFAAKKKIRYFSHLSYRPPRMLM